MSEILKNRINGDGNGVTPPNAWDFVKDTSYEPYKTKSEQEPGLAQPERQLQAHEVVKLFGVSNTQADTFQNLSPEDQVNEIRIALGELIGDPDDQEQIDYYVTHLTDKKAKGNQTVLDDLLNHYNKDYSRDELVGPKPNGPKEIVANRIVTINSPKYDTLLQRKKDIEQSFPDITSSQNTPARVSIPESVKDEYSRTVELMKLLADPVDELSGRDTSSDTYNILKGNLVVETSHKDEAEAYTEELKSLQQQNHDLIKHHEHPVDNVHKLIATWQTKLENVSNMQQYRTLEAEVNPYITPEESPYDIQGMLTIKDKISRPLRQKYIEIRLEEATKETKDLKDRHPGVNMPNSNRNSSLPQLEGRRSNLEARERRLQSEISRLDRQIANINEQLGIVTGLKNISQRKDKRALKEALAANEASRDQLKQQLEIAQTRLDLVNDKIAFLKTTQEIAALRQEQAAQAA